MARYIEQGKSIFIPFCDGYSITDSQLHLRMYKTKEMYKRHFPKGEKVDVLCEYAPIVRCKDCKHYYHSESSYKDGKCVMFGAYGTDPSVYLTDFCSYGERRTDDAEN